MNCIRNEWHFEISFGSFVEFPELWPGEPDLDCLIYKFRLWPDQLESDILSNSVIESLLASIQYGFGQTSPAFVSPEPESKVMLGRQ